MLMELLNSLVEGSSDAIFVAEAHSGLIVYANPAACRLFECTKEELIGKHQTELHPAEEKDEIVQKFKDFTKSACYKETTANVITKGGCKKLVLISSANLIEINGTTYASAYFKDISYTKKLQEIAHDQSHLVRRPLANILGLSHVLTELNVRTKKERNDILQKIQMEANALDSVINHIITKTAF